MAIGSGGLVHPRIIGAAWDRLVGPLVRRCGGAPAAGKTGRQTGARWR
ncbi:hypothetical protein OJJOAM_002277 [Cupriavidus sp. H18C1]